MTCWWWCEARWSSWEQCDPGTGQVARLVAVSCLYLALSSHQAVPTHHCTTHLAQECGDTRPHPHHHRHDRGQSHGRGRPPHPRPPLPRQLQLRSWCAGVCLAPSRYNITHLFISTGQVTQRNNIYTRKNIYTSVCCEVRCGVCGWCAGSAAASGLTWSPTWWWSTGWRTPASPAASPP